MKTKVSQSTLAEANKIIQPIISKDALSKFNKVLIDAIGPNVSITGTNGAIQIVCRFTGETEKDGILTLPGTYFNRFVSALPHGDAEIVKTGASKVKLVGSEGVNYSLASGEAADFFAFAAVASENKIEFDFPAATLREMFRKVMFSMSKDQTRAILVGVCFESKDGKVKMTATDGRRLAHVEKEMDGIDEFHTIIPAATVKLIHSLLPADDSDVGIAISGGHVSFTASAWQVTSCVIAGKYPSWKGVVPQNVETTAKLNRNKFLEGLERTALASDMGELSVVEVKLESGKVTLAARNDMTSAKVVVEDCVMKDGVVKEFRVCPQLVVEPLKAIDDEFFTLGFNNGYSPVVLKCSIPWLAVVMPIREK